MTGFGPGQPEVGSTGRVEYSQYVKVPLKSNYSWCQNPCRLSLAFIIYWRVMCRFAAGDKK